MISQEMALLKIMETVALPGELFTDGDCLDMIIHILEELGMPINEEINRVRKEYDSRSQKEWELMMNDEEEVIKQLQSGSNESHII